MRARRFVVAYTLRDGTRGREHCICQCSVDAVLLALRVHGELLQACSVRPVVRR